jgi:hypothetical protein
MTTTPRRREKRLDHLNAATVPVEGALLARAAKLEQVPEGAIETENILREFLAAEYRFMAEELHWHG